MANAVKSLIICKQCGELVIKCHHPQPPRNSFRTCRCDNPGRDDGQTTCWLHHDCSTGECTHYE